MNEKKRGRGDKNKIKKIIKSIVRTGVAYKIEERREQKK